MPFLSRAQMRWMFATHPDMARTWAHHTSHLSSLPEHVKKSLTDDQVDALLRGLFGSGSDDTVFWYPDDLELPDGIDLVGRTPDIAKVGGGNPYHDAQGHFTSKDTQGAGVPDSARTALGKIPLDTLGKPDAAGTLNDPVYVDSHLVLALQHIAQGHHVRLDQPDQVSTLLDKLAHYGDLAREKGNAARVFDLGKVSVPNTNLFTVESKGIPRAKMPQLQGPAIPGSPAAQPEFQSGGEANLNDAFRQELGRLGVKVEQTRIPASHLRATQDELNGGKVAAMVRAMDAGQVPEAPIFVTKDNYILDGHHRWAATVAIDARSGELGALTMPVYKCHVDIGTMLDLANSFATSMGIAPKDVTKMQPHTFSANGTILKIDTDKQQVFGWAQVAINKGESEPFFDSQGDRIRDVAHLEKAAYDFVLHSRQADSMHDEVAKATLIESVVFTPEKMAKMGLPEGSLPVGWWVGFHVTDPATWDRVKKGELRAFSVGGTGVRTPVADPNP